MEMAMRIGGWWRLWIVACVVYGVALAAVSIYRWPTLVRARLTDDFADLWLVLTAIVAWIVPCLIVLAFGFAVWLVRQSKKQ
jgi:hypothetical protein